MKLSGLKFAVSTLVVALSIATVVSISCKSISSQEESESSGFRKNHSDEMVLPENYETLSAAEKEDILFARIQDTTFRELPKLKGANPIKFITAHLNLKMDRAGDEAPVGYEKSIHAHGVVARVRFEAEPNSPYSGLFKGAAHGLIRLSVTSDPKGKDFAPGVALKLLVDGQPSRNVSFLYKLSGQKDNHNFFANELSNIIPIQLDPKSIFSSSVFGRVSRNPTKLSVKPFSVQDEKGQTVGNPLSPVQIYLVPNHANDFPAAVHEFRNDLLKLPSGTVLYDVYGTMEGKTDIVRIDEERREGAVKIGRLVTGSAFVASAFGDSRLFFRHAKFEDN